MNIEIISGSPRVGSLTHRIALHLYKVLSERSKHHIGLIDVREPAFPMIQMPYSSVEKAPEELRAVADRMFAADAFIVVTPEYNGGYSPAMKNLFDHFPKQLHKAFGIVTGSDGIMGGIRASQQVQLMVNGLMGIASPVMLITPLMDKKFDEAGNLVDEAFKGKVDTFLAEFIWLAERLKGE
jgi:NAD(P)H-dependent FMN reductase